MATLHGVVQPSSLTTPTRVHGLLPSISIRPARPMKSYPTVLPLVPHLSSSIASSLTYVSTTLICLVCSLAYTFITAVRSQNSQILHLRPQHASTACLRWLHPLQPIADLCSSESDNCWLLHSILPAQLPSSYLQGLLVSHHWCLGWC